MSPQMDKRAWAGLLVLSVLWGGSFFFVGVAVKEVPPLTIAAIRVFIAAMVLLAVLKLAGLTLPRRREVWQAFLIMGLLNNAIPFSLTFWGQTQIPDRKSTRLNSSH